MPPHLHSRIYSSDLLYRAVSQKQLKKNGHEDGDIDYITDLKNRSLFHKSEQHFRLLYRTLWQVRIENCEFSDDEAHSFASNDLCMPKLATSNAMYVINSSKLNRCYQNVDYNYYVHARTDLFTYATA